MLTAYQIGFVLSMIVVLGHVFVRIFQWADERYTFTPNKVKARNAMWVIRSFKMIPLALLWPLLFPAIVIYFGHKFYVALRKDANLTE